MLLSLLATALATVPPDSATWVPLATSPTRIDCTTYNGQPFCRSTGLISAPVDRASKTFEELDKYVSMMDSISHIARLESDTLHVVMDYPFPLDDRDYVAKFVHRTETNGTHVFAWTPVVHAGAPPADGVVRLGRLEGEWRFAPEGANTRVTYVWQADPGGNLPDVGAVRKKAGYLAVLDIANACGAKILSP